METNWTDSHSDYSSHLRVVQNFDTKYVKVIQICIYFFILTDFVINDSFLRFKFSHSLFTVLHTNGWTMLK